MIENVDESREAISKRLADDVGRAMARDFAKGARQDLLITQAQLAEAAGIKDVKTINNFEAGRTWPSATNRRAIARALGWKPDAFELILASGGDIEVLSRIEDKSRYVRPNWESVKGPRVAPPAGSRASIREKLDSGEDLDEEDRRLLRYLADNDEIATLSDRVADLPRDAQLEVSAFVDELVERYAAVELDNYRSATGLSGHQAESPQSEAEDARVLKVAAVKRSHMGGEQPRSDKQ